MRTILSASLLFLFATTAAAQLGTNPNLRPGRQPPDADQNNPGQADPADAGTAGPPPNAMFNVIDADGDGTITKAELRKAIVAIRKLDTDKDGNITLAEVGAGPVTPPAVASDPAQGQIEQMIAQYDKDGNGQLTANEIPRDMMPMLQNADTNNDKGIDRQELAAAMQNMPNQFQGGPGGGAPGPNGRGADEMTGRFIQQFDKDRDGKISSLELPPQLRQSFQATDDIDRDGLISPAELQAVMARMGGGARAWAGGVDPTGQRTPFRDPNRRGRPQPPENK